MRAKGFTLIEVLLAILVGSFIMAGTTAAYRQFNATAKINRAKAIIATMQSNIQAYKYRTGTPPSAGVLAHNNDDRNLAFYGSALTGNTPADASVSATAGMYTSTRLPPDPIYNNGTLYYVTTGTSSPAVSNGASIGGWLYFCDVGRISLNALDEDIPDDPPSKW